MPRPSLRLLIATVVEASALLSLNSVPDGPDGVLPFLLVMGVSSVAFGVICHTVVAMAHQVPTWAVVVTSVALHSLIVFSAPHFDDDLYRYTWDGKVLVAGHNPYAHPPNSLDLIELWRKDQYKIPYDYVSTIYPPATQLIFWATAKVAPDSFTALKLAFSAINIAVVVLIIMLLKQLGRPPTWALIYGWNPLVIKEVADSGHMDPWMMLWLIAAFYLFAIGRHRSAVFAWSISILCKLVPLALAPIIWKALPQKRWILVAPVMVGLAYLPFVDPDAQLFGGLSTYGRYWVFNPGLFDLIQMAVNPITELFAEDPSQLAAQVSRGIAGAGVGAIALWTALRMSPNPTANTLTWGALIILGSLLLLAPTVDPWYLIWIAPLVALHPTLPGILFTLLPLLSYGYYLHDQDPLVLRLIEYAILYGALALWLLQRRKPEAETGPGLQSQSRSSQ